MTPSIEAPGHFMRGSGFAIVLSLLVVACTPPKFPIEISDVSFQPEPVVGTIVEMSIEFGSDRDEREVTVGVQLPPEISLIDGALTWNGSLVADESETHRLSICVRLEGEWHINIFATSQLRPDSSYSDFETAVLRSSNEAALVILGKDYSFSQSELATYEAAITPSPSPAECT